MHPLAKQIHPNNVVLVAQWLLNVDKSHLEPRYQAHLETVMALLNDSLARYRSSYWSPPDPRFSPRDQAEHALKDLLTATRECLRCLAPEAQEYLQQYIQALVSSMEPE